jgi:hypothetical protein
MFTNGGLIGSSNSRYNSGLIISGWSSSQDVTKGSSDYVFNNVMVGGDYNMASETNQINPNEWTTYYPPHQFLSRVDLQVTVGDTYGDIDTKASMWNSAGQGVELMTQSSQTISTGITIIPAT